MSIPFFRTVNNSVWDSLKYALLFKDEELEQYVPICVHSSPEPEVCTTITTLILAN